MKTIFSFFAIGNLKSLDCGAYSFYCRNGKKKINKLHNYMSPNFPILSDEEPSLCIAIIRATCELVRRKIFLALFALYYSGFILEVK